MKNKILITALIGLLCMEIGFSQISFGARVSGSMTNITNVHSYSTSRGGFQVAALAMIPISDNDIFFFQPEINYSAQGEHDQPRRVNGDSEKQRVFLSFINIPLNAKIYFSDAESEFYGLIGPYIGFKIGERTDKLDFATEADDNDYAVFDCGATAGIGYSLNRQIDFSLRYSHGIVDLIKNDAGNLPNRTSILNLGVSYFFQ